MKRAFVVSVKNQELDNIQMKVDQVVPITEGRVNPFFLDELWKPIQKAVSSFDTAKDYIVPSGNSVANFLAGLALGLRGPKKVKLMIHDATNGLYKELVLDLSKEDAA